MHGAQGDSAACGMLSSNCCKRLVENGKKASDQQPLRTHCLVGDLCPLLCGVHCEEGAGQVCRQAGRQAGLLVVGCEQCLFGGKETDACIQARLPSRINRNAARSAGSSSALAHPQT